MLEDIWAGSEASLEKFFSVSAKVEAVQARADGGEVISLPSIYELQGDTGVVHINGTLLSGEAGFYQLFGYVGYDDIKAALLQAVQDRKAKSIMLAIDSPGGAVAGVTVAAEFVRTVNKVKPIRVFAETMASAAYWLGSGASEITLSSTGVAGSIGVIKVHTEYTKMLEKDGVTKTVMRAGQYKALGSPYEVYSAQAKAEDQEKLDYFYRLFVSDVASGRGVSPMEADQVMGQGRTFIGSQALKVGLVDAVGTYSSTLGKLAAGGGSPENSNPITRSQAKTVINNAPSAIFAGTQVTSMGDNPKMGNKLKPEYTEDQLTALAAGADPAAVLSAEQLAASQEPVVEPESAEADATTAEPTASLDTANVQAELATAQSALAQTVNRLTVAEEKVTAAESQVAAMGATQAKLVEIVGEVLASRHIAMGRKVDVSAMSADEMLASYAEITPLFKAKFIVGGAAKPSREEPKAKVQIDPVLRYATQSLVKKK